MIHTEPSSGTNTLAFRNSPLAFLARAVREHGWVVGLGLLGCVGAATLQVTASARAALAEDC